MSSSRSSLVLGFAARLAPELIEPFVRSLHATGYAGRIGFVLADYPDRERKQLQHLADFSVDIEELPAQAGNPHVLAGLRWLRATRGFRRAYPAAFRLCAAAARERNALARWEALELALEGLQALRYKHYYNVLQAVAPDAERILLTDLRDVLFQRDPFSTPVEELELFLEDPSQTIGREHFNRTWIEALYGPGVSAGMRECIASCSGTVIGSREGILHYLTEMQTAITWRRRPLGSHDQGVHNYLLRAGRFAAATVIPNGHGRVLTMGGMSKIRCEGGRVLNADDTVPAILHQYDRHPPLAAALLRDLVHRRT